MQASTPTLQAIYQEQADFVTRSGFTVSIDYAQSWVTIESSNEELFLQGQQADEFIDRAANLTALIPDLADADLATAYGYLDAVAPKD
jgi:hypothetical protein